MDTPTFIDPLARILAPQVADRQAPLLAACTGTLQAAVASLALGGAERIVLDWAARHTARHGKDARVRIAVLRQAVAEWPVPPGVEVVRFHGESIGHRLEAFAAQALASGDSPVVACHLLTSAQRAALRAGGAKTVPVLHNAASGWIEPAAAMVDDHLVIAVSGATAADYRAAGGRLPCKVVKHFPRATPPDPAERAAWRERWALPRDAWVIGMVGAIKPQKAYTRALRVLHAILERDEAPGPAYLVIVGGPTGRDGETAMNALLAQALRLGVESRVRLAGFVTGAARCLPAFDTFLNTSRYEGLSIATMEALAAGLPVVASDVGGQREVAADGVSLVAFDAPDETWARAVVTARAAPVPAWARFPGERQWTLAQLARPFEPVKGRVLFVTANLNAGGAQRSLVNLALGLQGRLDFEIAVTGDSSTAEFSDRLLAGGVRHFRTSASRDCFDHAEALTGHVTKRAPACVCFWNVDAKVKLLVVKWLGHTKLRFVDVSPGDYLFEEMEAARGFQDFIAFGAGDYFARLDRLVQKYRAPARPGLRRKTLVIPNGVPCAPARSRDEGGPPRVALCGRIAPGKFVLEAIEAMRLVRESIPTAELHLLGTAEAREQDYALQVASAAGPDAAAGRIVFHGAAFDAPARLGAFDAVLVLGRHQGCPNTVLEALAAGVPVVANDSGGTRELVLDGRTGFLLAHVEPRGVAGALRTLLGDRMLRNRMSVLARRHAEGKFSMQRMARSYLRLFR